jgi:hypothetical protein
MMPSPPIDDRYDTCHSCRLAAASAQARIPPLDAQPVAPPIVSRNGQPARSLRRAHPGFAANRSRQPLRSNLIKPNPVAKSP